MLYYLNSKFPHAPVQLLVSHLGAEPGRSRLTPDDGTLELWDSTENPIPWIIKAKKVVRALLKAIR